jgi:DNA-directed RNA polymerase specialized sigma24 family protein
VPGQRRALELFSVGGLALAETAAALDIDAGAVKARLFKGWLALRRRLQADPTYIPRNWAASRPKKQ